jgi:hypothetical protein
MHQNTTCHSGGAGYSWERLRVELFDVILFGVSALAYWLCSRALCSFLHDVKSEASIVELD